MASAHEDFSDLVANNSSDGDNTNDGTLNNSNMTTSGINAVSS